MSKQAKGFGQDGFVGKEIPGDDLTGDFDPMAHEHADTPLEELDQMIENDIGNYGEEDDAKAGVKRHADQEPDEPSEVEQEAAVDGDQEEDQQEEESEEEQQAAPEAEESSEQEEPAAEPPSGEDRLSSIERQLQIAQLQNEKIQADTDKWRLVAERESARAGNLQHQLKQPRQQQDSYADDYDQPQSNQRQEADSASEDQRAILEDMNIRAMQEVQNEFLAEAEKFLEGVKDQNGASEAFTKEFGEGVMKHRQELQEAATRGRPRAAATLTRSILRSAMADAKIGFLRRQEEQARAMKQQQKSTTRARKRAASGVKTQHGAASKARQAQKYDPLRVDLDDFDRRLDEELGTNKDIGTEFI